MRRTLSAVLLAVCLAFSSFSVLQAEKTEKKTKNKKEDVSAIGDRDVDGKVNFYSLEKEIALGKQLADEIERTAIIVDDPPVAEYVNRIGQNLARNSDSELPFYFKVVEGEQVNAFALPGGYLFVYTGLILKSETEGELAGVLAHEIAHVAARHGTRQATRGQIANLATIPLIFLGGWTGFGVRQAASMAIPIGFLQFSRGFETEADFLGLQYLYKSGYDPIAFVDFFERLQSMEKRKPGTLSKVFTSHPMTDDRIAAAQKSIQEILPSKPEYVVSTSEFLTIKERLESQLYREKGDADPSRPRMRRGPATTAPIERPGSGSEPSEEDDEDRPVLTRRGPDEGVDGKVERPADPLEDDEDRPTITRRPAAEDATVVSSPEAPPSDEDDDRPVLTRPN